MRASILNETLLRTPLAFQDNLIVVLFLLCCCCCKFELQDEERAAIAALAGRLDSGELPRDLLRDEFSNQRLIELAAQRSGKRLRANWVGRAWSPTANEHPCIVCGVPRGDPWVTFRTVGTWCLDCESSGAKAKRRDLRNIVDTCEQPIWGTIKSMSEAKREARKKTDEQQHLAKSDKDLRKEITSKMRRLSAPSLQKVLDFINHVE